MNQSDPKLTPAPDGDREPVQDEVRESLARSLEIHPMELKQPAMLYAVLRQYQPLQMLCDQRPKPLLGRYQGLLETMRGIQVILG